MLESSQIDESTSGSNERQEVPQIGVAISGGGHRATLWGLGTLLYLADAGLNARTSTISSVSGGSIINGAVMQRTRFRETNGADFRERIQPVLTHITREGLFFYGKPTNTYLRTLLFAAATFVSLAAAFAGLALIQLVRFVLEDLDQCACSPIKDATVWMLLLPALIVFPVTTWAANRYAEHTDTGLRAIAAIVVVAVAGLAIMNATGQWDIDVAYVLAMYLLLLGSSLAALVVVLMFVRRSRVAEHAMKRAYFGDATLESAGQEPSRDVPGGDTASAKDCLHVICATDLASGIHTYFSDRFIYNAMHGITTETDTVQLATAVQASAALPGAFNARTISKDDLNFRVLWGPDSDEGSTPQGGNPLGARDEIRGHPLVLVDGGVYDNMADQWFEGIERRRTEWADRGEDASMIEPVDFLVLSNASAGWRWRKIRSTWSSTFLTVREVSSLSRDYQIMYNTIARRRRRHIVDLWKYTPAQGALVQIDRAPLDTLNVRSPQADRIKDAVTGLGLTAEEWNELVRHSDSYPTVLRRVKPERARRILWHSYVLTAVSVSSWLGTEMTRLPTIEEFATIDGDYLRLT